MVMGTRVSLRAAREGFGAAADDVETAGHIVAPVIGEGVAFEDCFEAAGDGREGVIEFVAEDADEALPGLEFFFAERTGEVSDDEELVGEAAFAERRAGDAASCDP